MVFVLKPNIKQSQTRKCAFLCFPRVLTPITRFSIVGDSAAIDKLRTDIMCSAEKNVHVTLTVIASTRDISGNRGNKTLIIHASAVVVKKSRGYTQRPCTAKATGQHFFKGSKRYLKKEVLRLKLTYKCDVTYLYELNLSIYNR